MIAYDDGRRYRPRARRLAPVDAVEAVRRVHRMVIDQLADSLTLAVETSGAPMLVDIGRRPLELVLLNLIFHAHDRRAGEQARIRLDVARVDARATPGASPHEPADACYARLRVTDDGPALSEDDCARLFAAGAAGAGHALAVVCIIVRDAGGLMSVEQRPDGTTISVFLPVLDPLDEAPATRHG